MTLTKEEGYQFGNDCEDFVVRILNQRNGLCTIQGLTARANNRGPNKADKAKIDIEIVYSSTGAHHSYLEVKANKPFEDPKDCNAIYAYHSGNRMNSFQNEFEPYGYHCSYAYLNIATGKLLLMTDQMQLRKMLDINYLEKDLTMYGNRWDDVNNMPCSHTISNLANDFMYLKTLIPEHPVWQYILDVGQELKTAPELSRWLKNYKFSY